MIVDLCNSRKDERPSKDVFYRWTSFQRCGGLLTVGHWPWQFPLQFLWGSCHTLILNNQADGFNLFFALAASLISRVVSAKSISNKQVFAFDVLEVKVISHNSARHSLKSNGILPSRSNEYRSKWFVDIMHCYYSSIGIVTEPCRRPKTTLSMSFSIWL